MKNILFRIVTPFIFLGVAISLFPSIHRMAKKAQYAGSIYGGLVMGTDGKAHLMQPSDLICWCAQDGKLSEDHPLDVPIPPTEDEWGIPS